MKAARFTVDVLTRRGTHTRRSFRTARTALAVATMAGRTRGECAILLKLSRCRLALDGRRFREIGGRGRAWRFDGRRLVREEVTMKADEYHRRMNACVAGYAAGEITQEEMLRETRRIWEEARASGLAPEHLAGVIHGYHEEEER